MTPGSFEIAWCRRGRPSPDDGRQRKSKRATRRIEMPNQPPMIPSLATTGPRIEHCIVCRESDQYGYALMEGMIGQTLGHLTDIPGVEDVLAAGVAPLRGEGPFKLFPYRSGKTTAVLFGHLGVLY